MAARARAGARPTTTVAYTEPESMSSPSACLPGGISVVPGPKTAPSTTYLGLKKWGADRMSGCSIVSYTLVTKGFWAQGLRRPKQHQAADSKWGHVF